MYGKSVSNQRIEAWWGQLRKGCCEWWINHFKDMRDSGLYCDANILHVNCLRFCYMQLIREELHRAARQWNLHRIRPSRNLDSPQGRPDTLYYLPSLWSEDARDCKHQIDTEDIDIAEELCSISLPNCSPAFAQLATIIMNENRVVLSRDPQVFLRLPSQK